MAIVFVICIIGMYIISVVQNPKGDRANGLEVDTKMFRVSNSFAVGSLIIGGILVALYSIFW
jgi:SSS family solute:Na+ symporter